ncbi:unnamed protein product [Urochloa decumbens]|uniref:BHLH domain-containing protein n=1 Tax=Urochloa decumbens TaxID=240449 RepID=A0ABC9GFX3_9POAL
MNYPGHDPADPWWCFPGDDAGDGDAGEAATAAAGDTSSSFADVLADYSTDDLFDLAWEQGGEGAGSAPESTTIPPSEPCRLSSPPPGFKPPPPPAAEVRLGPPSEEEMAAWLSAIVKGEELAITGDGREDVASKGSSDASMSTDDTKEKLPITEGISSKQQEIKNPPEGGSSRSHHGEAHNLTEKRRRNKIKERLRTLQQLVPGCDKSNQASTLDQTIQYMKTLQHHLQKMSGGSAHPPAAEIPVVPPRYAPPGAPVAVPIMPATPMVLAPAPTSMVPFEAMFQMPHYPTAVPVMMPAAAASLYPVAAPARVTVAPEDAGSSASHRQGSSRSKGRSGSSRRQKH